MKQTYKSEVYHSCEGRHLLHNLYRKLLMEMKMPLSEYMVATRFGDTHVMQYGNPSGQPVLVFYGDYALNPFAVRPLLQGLDLTRMRLIVPDPVGQVGFSEEKRPSLSGDESGEWACEVMDGLALPEAPVLGYSFGAGVALQLCQVSVLHVERLLLVMPSGFTSLSSSKIARLTEPAGKGSALTEEDVKKALQPVLPFPQKEVTDITRLLFLHAKTRRKDIKCFKKNHLRKLNAQVCLIAEKSDYLFPGEDVIKQAARIIPNMGNVHLLSTGGSHCSLFNPDAGEALADCFALMSDFILKA